MALLSLKWNLGFVNFGNGETQTASTNIKTCCLYSFASFPVVNLGKISLFS